MHSMDRQNKEKGEKGKVKLEDLQGEVKEMEKERDKEVEKEVWKQDKELRTMHAKVKQKKKGSEKKKKQKAER